jgi:hypothetical protein
LTTSRSTITSVSITSGAGTSHITSGRVSTSRYSTCRPHARTRKDNTIKGVVVEEVVKEIEVEKVVEVEKLKRVLLPIEYYSYQCGRDVIKHGKVLYVINGGLVRLTDKWYKVSHSCQLRVKKNRLEVK